ncbi:DNA-directed RNA polymerase subunit alpha C-terminal domain-containing protein [Hymenobacter sp. ASUV-10]|uniref:DNA-directed RNA polymerase subunit alpha C-terminal domain-containing protein n=1 Tax=Hymenobacter aranciens TaxID=3063996 RepID=A0ABT9B7H4_9BACT|nr:DNA-directed RNA polymerase subunit alpha C-terminal domain-containing protein [Hymenobacter sp. ASUV-10]MDO7874230.1 DNA-directed RNA polymerase subunit alpha C-terminal domain-containing protein [Hymenobacter sp. ASUV-10]
MKDIGKLVDALKFGFRTLKSTKEVNRRRTIQTILERAQKLRESVQPLGELLDNVIADCERQINIDPPAVSPAGFPYASKLSELGLPARACNAMESIGILTLGDLAGVEYMDLMRAKGFGKVSMGHIEDLLDKTGVVL